MDAKNVGTLIAALRKKRGMTQIQLAEKLNISDKTVSRWENGLGYPEITLFPELAAQLGVTVDYLLTGERKGITVAGSIIADIVKCVDCYPEIGMLANVTEIRKAVGGCAPNTAMDLAAIDRTMPLSVAGRIGEDEYGRFILSQLTRRGVDCSRITASASLPTSFSDVMSLPTGERTFFSARGANAEFSPKDVDIAGLNCVILHIGYILLLDEFDRADEQYGTVMARFLHDVQQAGIKTSVDVVSHSTADYKAKIIPALKYCNYAIMNELESSKLSDLSPVKPDGSLDVENIRRTMEFMAGCGVKDKVIIHCRTAGFCLDVPSGRFTVVPSLQIPEPQIKGNVGAGDAFCAGCLYGLYHHYDDRKMLELAAAAAASSLFAENATDGMRNRSELEKLAEIYEKQQL